MTAKTIEVLNPTGRVARMDLAIAPRVDDLNGKTLGLIDNGKPNFGIFLSRVEELLSQKFRFADVIHAKKALTGMPLDKDKMEKLVADCDVVVSGMCD